MNRSSRPTAALVVANERGLTLFISLIFLLLLTLIGMAAMTTDSLESALATNNQDSDVAFQAAETGLTVAEAYVENQVTPGSGFNASCTGGLCLPSTTSSADWAWAGGAANWLVPSVNNISLAGGSNVVPGVAMQPEFIVELLPNLPRTNLGLPSQTQQGTAYRITAVGWGKRLSSHAMLQVVFIKG